LLLLCLLGVWCSAPRRLGGPIIHILVFIIANQKIVFIGARAILVVRKTRQDTRSSNRIPPPSAWVKVLAQAGEVVFGRGGKGRQPWLCEGLLCCEAAGGVWI
jgi:hypothetical protein